MTFETLIDALADPAFSGRLCLTLAHSLWLMAALAAAGLFFRVGSRKIGSLFDSNFYTNFRNLRLDLCRDAIEDRWQFVVR